MCPLNGPKKGLNCSARASASQEVDMLIPMIGENWQSVTDESVKFEK